MYHVQCRVHWTVLSAVPVQCRVTLDSAFRYVRFTVELHSKFRSTVPGPMSSYIRQCVPLYQVQCRVTMDSAFCCTTSNVELHSTVRSATLGSLSSYTPNFVPLYQVQCRVTLDSAFRCTKSSVELRSTVIIQWDSSFSVRTEGRADGQTVTTTLIVTFRNLLKASDKSVLIHTVDVSR